ncbi:MAG: DUF4097 and DUF4098 domain-containing protein YvlB [Candidatus Azotimanducaceae bacterium]|jgi:DUF4097 and DUF4098 domain-containing protein YvlB
MLQKISALGLSLALMFTGGCVIEVDASDWDDDFFSERDNTRDRHRDRDGGNIHKVFGGIKVHEGETVGNIDSVNGGISMSDNSTGEDVEAVNGSVRIQDKVSVDSIETVNGSIRAGHSLRVQNDVSTVNGSITLKEGSVIGGGVETVNGSITIQGTTVDENISTLNGDIEVLSGSKVSGDIIFEEKRRKEHNRQRSELVVDADSVIEGTIHLYQDVELKIEDGAKVGKIIDHYHEA